MNKEQFFYTSNIIVQIEKKLNQLLHCTHYKSS